MDPITRALHVRAETAEARPAVTPIYQCSGFETGSAFFYTRKANPNTVELEEVVRTMEEARHGLAVTTGMTAIAMVLDLLAAGDHLVVNRDLYGCSFKLFQRAGARRGFTVEVLDLSQDADVLRIPAATRMVFFETPTNPFLKTIDIAKVATFVKERNRDALVVVDNTWATPIFQHPLAHGADLSLHSATKYLSGHTDVMGGVILTDRDELDARLREDRFYTGAILDPHSSWLLRRSAQTLALRMRHHERVTAELVPVLERLPQVKHVYAPRVDGRQLRGYGGIVFVDLRDDLAARYPALSEELELFQTGTGMACVTSMVAQPWSGSHASMTADEKVAMGLGPGLVRLCFGLEEPADLVADLTAAFARLDA